MAGAKSFGSVFKAVGGVLTLALAYLGVAVAAHWPPFGSTTAITMDSPENGSEVSGNFAVALSGSLAPESQLWVMAFDASQKWYPLSEATATSSPGHWHAEIHSEQIESASSPVNLCAITVDNATSAGLPERARRGQPLATPPAKSDQQACAKIRPAQR
ncbi:MAG: hypothetical protein J2P32_02770 [Actinobacteria bacterium]|nr:hypothetical protein [Actinomycetota bacterium]